MSSKSSSSSPALGSRENFWGGDADDDPDATADERGHGSAAGTNPAEHKARELALRFTDPICRRQRDEAPWNGGRLAELCAWLVDGECIDGRGDQLHHEQRPQRLTEPMLPMPKQADVGSHTIEYGSHRCRRRYNPETGYINWGDSTGTAVENFGRDVFDLCTHTYLGERDCRLTAIEEYLEFANQVWCDPQYDSLGALIHFIAKVREWEDGETGE